VLISRKSGNQAWAYMDGQLATLVNISSHAERDILVDDENAMRSNLD